MSRGWARLGGRPRGGPREARLQRPAEAAPLDRVCAAIRRRRRAHRRNSGRGDRRATDAATDAAAGAAAGAGGSTPAVPAVPRRFSGAHRFVSRGGDEARSPSWASTRGRLTLSTRCCCRAPSTKTGPTRRCPAMCGAPPGSQDTPRYLLGPTSVQFGQVWGTAFQPLDKEGSVAVQSSSSSSTVGAPSLAQASSR